MCWQAWQANPAAMWTWNGLIQDNVNDNHQARVPDGQLCGGGDPTYAALDNPGLWRAQEVNNTFTWTMHDQARHGAEYVRIYVTRQGFDPVTQPLTWSDLELVLDTGPFPAEGPTTDDPILNGVSYSYEISAPGRTGTWACIKEALPGFPDFSARRPPGRRGYAFRAAPRRRR